MHHSQITRRDFLKLAGAGAIGLALSELHIDRAFASPIKHGRMTVSGIPLYDAPAFNAKQLSLFGRDEVIEVLEEVDGKTGNNPFNQTWYKIEGGYTYSGWIQPVETRYQKAVFNIPPNGQVAEITVPFTDVRIDPYTRAKRGYRLYYGSTHWVKKVVVTREEKSIWYAIYDSHLQKTFFVPHYNLRLIPDDELTLLSPDVPEEEKYIRVDLNEQLVAAFEGDKLVLSVRCSSGQKGTRTPTGKFRTFHKGPSIHMTNEGDNEAKVFDLPGVPWCSFFTGVGNAFHGTYWHNDYGRPRSHGCVNLPSEAAKFIYRWTMPNVPPGTDYLHLPGQGTHVEIV